MPTVASNPSVSASVRSTAGTARRNVGTWRQRTVALVSTATGPPAPTELPGPPAPAARSAPAVGSMPSHVPWALIGARTRS